SRALGGGVRAARRARRSAALAGALGAHGVSSPAWGRQAKGPLVIAHRGASADAVENTIAAFRLAREQGADGVELDVMRCATGEVVVFHDDDLGRLGGYPGDVRALSFAELRAVELHGGTGGGERIP